MQDDIAIVIAAYNRPASLLRLLNSIAAANFYGYRNIELLISIDYSGNNDCKQIAEAFEWKYGQKIIFVHEKKLGLKNHILQCGDLTQQYAGLIVLEDDIYVSPFFYQYAQQAFNFFKGHDSIGGIALYHNAFNEVALCPFEAMHDGYDNYFMQVPCSWGQLWTKEQWKKFRDYIQQEIHFSETDMLPTNVLMWPTSTSWKKIFYKYLVDTQRYFVYPRIGLSTNFGEEGEHLTESLTVFQTPLLLAEKQFNFSSLGEALSIYDAFFELESNIYQKIFETGLSVSFDLNATKPLSKIKTKYLVSAKKCSQPQRKYAISLYPYENNILMNIQDKPIGDYYFSFGETKDFSENKLFERFTIDVKRLFMSHGVFINAARKQVEQSSTYRLGQFLLKPYYFLKRILKQS